MKKVNVKQNKIGYVSCKLYSGSQPVVGLKTPKRNAFGQFSKFEFHFEHFQETHDFLVLTDPVIICIYLRTTDRHFPTRGTSVVP